MYLDAGTLKIYLSDPEELKNVDSSWKKKERESLRDWKFQIWADSTTKGQHNYMTFNPKFKYICP